MKNVIFAKYSNDRNRRFSVRTEILEDEEGVRTVRKLPAFPEAAEHVASIYHWYKVLSAQTADTKLSYNVCKKIPEGVELEYLRGQSLEEHLLTIMHQEGEDACAEELMTYLQFIKRIHSGAKFKPTDAFREVFGNASLPISTDCSPCTNIDLLCENIYVSGTQWTAIDYEWSFDFPIPVNFLLYRIILHFTDNANRGEEFKRFDFMSRMGITDAEITAFAAMEAHFQQYILSDHIPICNLYRDVSTGYVLTDDLTSSDESLQIYNKIGDDFSEENSVFYPMHYFDHWTAKVSHPIPKETTALRLDPGDRPAIVHLKTLRFDNQDTAPSFFLREGAVSGEWLYFSEDDPNLFIGEIPEGAVSLLIEFDLYVIVPETMKEVAQIFGKNVQMNQQILQTEDQIRQMDSQISQKTELIRQKDELMAQKDEQMAQRDAQLGFRDDQIRHRDEQIGQRDEQIRHRDEQIHLMDGRLREMDDQMHQMNDQIGKMNDEIQSLNQQNQQLNAQIEALENLKVMKIWRKLHALKKTGD